LAGFALVYQQSKVAQAEEKEESQESPKPVAEDVEEDLMGSSTIRELTGDRVKEVLTNRESKLIYFYRKSTLNLDEFKRVSEFSEKIENGMRVVPYKIDLDQNYDALVAYLKERNPKTAEQTEEQIKTHAFLLANQYDDIWYWELDLINYFYGELLEQIFNFFQGPLKLISAE
jgi:hypothetical protein